MNDRRLSLSNVARWNTNHTCSSGALPTGEVKQAVESVNAIQQIGVVSFWFIVRSSISLVCGRRLFFDNRMRRSLIGRVCVEMQ